MSLRRQGREAAIQFLYQLDLNTSTQEEVTGPFWILLTNETDGATPQKTREFADLLIAGVTEHRAEIDRRIQACVVNFELWRLAAVDRNILRVAIFELLHSPELSPSIIINEAIEIAKRFGGEKSGGFVNGILDRINKDLGLGGRRPAGFPQVGPLGQAD